VLAIPVLSILMISAAVDGIDRALSLTAYAAFASWFALMGVARRIEPWLFRPRPAIS
jgi:hypothetical protein